MALTAYTSYDEVRSALGVSIEELPDSELALPLYEVGLKVELKLIGPTLISDYDTALQTPSNSRTDAETDLVDAMKLFATYSVAKQLTTSLPLFSPKEMSDNKAMMVRYSTDPYKEVKAGVSDKEAKYREYLTTTWAAYNSTTRVSSTRRWFAISASSTIDPVTGS